MNLRKWISLAIFLTIFYYAFIANFFVTISIIIGIVFSFRIYKWYARKKRNKLANSKEQFEKSELGLFIALVAKVAKADGRVDELEAQLIGMMFDDISKLFDEKEKARAIMKEIFNDEKERDDDTKEKAQALNTLLGRSVLKRRQFVSFLIQLAFVGNGISDDEDKVLRLIVTELNVTQEQYEAILKSFENMKSNKQNNMSSHKAYEILGVKESDDMGTIKKAYRKLVREYHPDIISSQDKDESYVKEATAKTQEINQAYNIIKELKTPNK